MNFVITWVHGRGACTLTSISGRLSPFVRIIRKFELLSNDWGIGYWFQFLPVPFKFVGANFRGRPDHVRIEGWSRHTVNSGLSIKHHSWVHAYAWERSLGVRRSQSKELDRLLRMQAAAGVLISVCRIVNRRRPYVPERRNGWSQGTSAKASVCTSSHW